MEVSTFITFCTKVYLLGTAECYKFAILRVVQSCCTVVLCMLAEDLCTHDNETAFLDHKTYYTETK